MASQTGIFNTDPYYDDFDAARKFLKILFRPSYAVQARELTQIQTTLQEQVARFANHIFEDGSLVYGGSIIESEVNWIRIRKPGATGSAYDNHETWIGREIEVAGQNVKGRVVHAIPGTGGTDDFVILFFYYRDQRDLFDAGETIRVVGQTSIQGRIVNSGDTSADATGTSTLVTVDEGIFYVDGYFIRNDKQVISPFRLQSGIRLFDNPTARIGFRNNNRIVTSNDDNSLNDPSFGSPNFAAPGADRFQITLDLDFIPFDNTSSTPSEFADDDFIELIRIVNGKTTRRIRYPQYSEIEKTLARRTYDESGSYTVVPFQIDLREHLKSEDTPDGLFTEANGGDNDLFVAGLEPGKAYVFGYEFENLATEYLNVEKARDTERSGTVPVNTPLGNYVIVDSPLGNWDDTLLQESPQVILAKDDTPDPVAIGTARLRAILRDGGEYRMYLYNIRMDDPQEDPFGDVDLIFLPGADVTTDDELAEIDTRGKSSGNTILFESARNTLLFPYPFGEATERVHELEYSVQQTFEIAFSGDSGSATTTSSKVRFIGAPTVSSADLGNYILLDDSGAEVDLTTGTTITTNNDVGGFSSPGAVEITKASLPDGTYYLLATLRVTDTGESTPTILRNKTLTTVTEADRTLDSVTKQINLQYSDVYDVETVEIINTNTSEYDDVTDLFTLDTGQKDNLYDHARLIPVDPDALDDYSTVDEEVRVTFRYFAHTGTGPITVDSYPDYEEVPSYTSSITGRTQSLREVIDFRPVRENVVAYSATATQDADIGNLWFPQPNSASFADWSFYLSRQDKIVLDRDRRFRVIQGIPALEPELPLDDPEAMTLYTMRVGAYTFSLSDVGIRYIDNKRFTMRDIGQIEDRVDRIEYLTALSLLEEEAKGLSITDNSGDEMFKTGILVDSFAGHNIGDISNPDYACAIDTNEGILRPSFNSNEISLVRNTDASATNLFTTSDGLWMMSHTTATAVQQPFSSSSRAVNPAGRITWLGSMRLSPFGDTWFDKSIRPKIRSNVDGINDAWVGSETFGFGNYWNDWKIHWAGQETLERDPGIGEPRSIFDDEDTNLRDRFITTISRNADTRRAFKRIGKRLLNIPQSIRRMFASRVVDLSVVPYIRPRTITASLRGLRPNATLRAFFDGIEVTEHCGGLTTNSTGATVVVFNIPAGQFRTGSRLFRVMDAEQLSNATTLAEAIYHAEGLMETANSLSVGTRPPTIRREGVGDSRIVSSVVNRPTTNRGSNLSNWIDPLSQVFTVDPNDYPEGMFVKSVDLYFAAKDNNLPVTVQLRPLTNGYPHPSMVLPFAEVTRTPATIPVTNNPSIDNTATRTVFEFSSPVYLPPGDYAIAVVSNSDQYRVHTGVLGDVRTGSNNERISEQPNVGHFYRPQNSGQWVEEVTENLMFRLQRCVFATGGANATSFELRNPEINNGPEYVYDKFFMLTSDLVPRQTRLDYTVFRTTLVNGSTSQPLQRIFANQNNTLEGRRRIKTDEEDPEIRITVELQTSNDAVCPLLDNQRRSMFLIENVVTNFTDTNTGSANYNGELEPLTPQGPNRSRARYITRRVSLPSGMESEDISVFASVNIPSGASIQVFAKLMPVNADESFDEQPYIQLTTDDDLIASSNDEFVDVHFRANPSDIPEPFNVYAIKIVMHASNTLQVPRIQNLRAISTV